MSDLFPQLARCVDDMAFIHSMQSKSALHGPAMFMMNSGFIRPGFPSMGSWVTYGLGSESDEPAGLRRAARSARAAAGRRGQLGRGLPARRASGDRARIRRGASRRSPICSRRRPVPAAPEARCARELLPRAERRTRTRPAGDALLEPGSPPTNWPARLQLSAPEVADLTRGDRRDAAACTASMTRTAGPFGRQCLLARRLVERGVRFVQIYLRRGEHHRQEDPPELGQPRGSVRDHGYWGPILDSGAAALLKDLKRGPARCPRS